ncbi:hypothetical protein [Vogesella indigofera]|uniref:hypothetical protein n=1 Tax=Vogesella indigofera TaxID=45465 RepID=UPI003F43647D
MSPARAFGIGKDAPEYKPACRSSMAFVAGKQQCRCDVRVAAAGRLLAFMGFIKGKTKINSINR